MSGNEAACAACDLDPSGRHGLPVDDAGEIVANDAPSAGNVAACAHCYAVHAAGGPAALAAHVAAVRDLAAEVKRLRWTLGEIITTATLAEFAPVPSLEAR